jgi:hypothetical protein
VDVPPSLPPVRRYWRTASGAKIAKITKAQTKAPQTWSSAGRPSHSERIALTMIVNGLTSANHSRAGGIESVGTNAEEMNVSGNTTVNPTEFAASGELTSIPSRAKTHENA